MTAFDAFLWQMGRSFPDRRAQNRSFHFCENVVYYLERAVVRFDRQADPEALTAALESLEGVEVLWTYDSLFRETTWS